MSIRSFLAFELAPKVREQIKTVSTELQKTRMPVRWVKVDNIHLTIIFLGSVNEDKIDDIKEKVNSVVKRFSIFKTRLNGVGVFPNWRRPRVIWVGLNGEIERLSRFRDELQTELKVLGLKEEKRPYRPHLTIGRFKGASNRDEELKWIIDRYHDITSDQYYLNELVFFKSDLKPDGPVYTKMASWPLTAADSHR
jgi:2'-5' RNA ligase